MGKALFTGAATALVTPFKNGEVDVPAFDRMVERQLEAGIQALFPVGTTGEPATLTVEEWELVIRRTVEICRGRIPVIAGTGGNNTKDVIERAARAKALGADAQLCVTPYYNKTTQGGLFAHYQAITENSALPVIVYSVPGRTGMSIAVDTCVRLSRLSQIIGLKEAGGDVGRTIDILAACGGALPVYCGSDEITVPMLAAGTSGVVSVLSNAVPEAVTGMTAAWYAGDTSAAAALQIKYQPLVRLLFRQVSPIPVKAALAAMRLCENSLRLPLFPLTEEEQAPLLAELKKLEIIE
ncbi:MAG: 4-hydroxy-tetrahydrodipicolinate synthase [Clostridia bacterium]|nr:4-hydroxy-tetrahydrodipicolinate synthase [Clostridia bacterium]